MAPIPPIFNLVVPAYKSSTHTAPEGSFTLTQPAPQVYLLTFNSPPDNRLTPIFLDTFSLALDIILTLPPGVVMTTSSITKFYSNGLDYGAAVSDKNFLTNHLFPFWRKLLTYPWPTIAVMNGHAFAGGLMTAMAHDYRIHNPHRGYICLNELDFNSPLTPPMAGLFRVKLSMTTFRTLILEAKRFSALQALEAGIIDSVGDTSTALTLISELGLTKKCRPLPTSSNDTKTGEPAYQLIKSEMYREIIADLDVSGDQGRELAATQKKDRWERLQVARKEVEKWKAGGGTLGMNVKAKL